mgnify:FL=1|jgi:hypothetical protein
MKTKDKLQHIEEVIKHMIEHDADIAFSVLAMSIDMMLSVASDKRLMEKGGQIAMMPMMVKMVFDMNAAQLQEDLDKVKFVKVSSDIANEDSKE